MKSFIIYEKDTGKILRVGGCSPRDFSRQQLEDSEEILEGEANPRLHKIRNGKVVNKTPEEIESEKVIPLPKAKRRAFITNEQWQALLQRIDGLEAIVEGILNGK